MLHADFEYVAHVLEVARDQVQAAIGIVAPSYRNLFDAIAEAPGDRQDLDVEHIGIDLLTPEELFGGVLLEELKAALCIVDAGEADYRLHEIEEAFRTEPAIERL